LGGGAEHLAFLSPHRFIVLSSYLKIVLLSRRYFLTSLLAICFSAIVWCNFTPTAWAIGGKLPTVNQPAPEFTLPTNTGKGKISLSDYAGKWVVLYFYPKDFTSGCTLEARRFQQDIAKYQQRQTEIVGVSADSIDSHAEFCDSEGLKFPLLADTNGAISKAYGSWLGIFSMRHSFIIDPQGVLRATFTDVNPTTHSQEILTALDKLQIKKT
jgi:thioredoxin-dependent peroxiredoxin